MTTAAEQRRDEILRNMIERHGPWNRRALSYIRVLTPGEEFTGEQIKLSVLEMGLEPPEHHNAWGSVIKMALKRGMLEPTGEYRNTETVRSHARRTPVYRRLGAVNPPARRRLQPVAGG